MYRGHLNERHRQRRNARAASDALAHDTGGWAVKVGDVLTVSRDGV